MSPLLILPFAPFCFCSISSFSALAQQLIHITFGNQAEIPDDIAFNLCFLEPFFMRLFSTPITNLNPVPRAPKYSKGANKCKANIKIHY